ncbi:MAG TPA: hypothetical protein VKV16_11920, partial [Solirubrobacteraceae bacterium]|nr:hypothetical protein [Solirubrobacteraceae bacterium]
MVPANTNGSRERLALVRWVAGLGAITAEALACHDAITLGSARARLHAAERAGLLRGERLLVGEPKLFTSTSRGLKASGLHGLRPCRISVANAPHAIACARATAALERAYPDHRVMGERELRLLERELGEPVGSARLQAPASVVDAIGAPTLHRPDLVLWPAQPEGLPVAVEVELTVKAPRRLEEICRAWARCRSVAGTLYLADEHVLAPLARAIARAQAGERIALVALDALADPPLAG